MNMPNGVTLTIGFNHPRFSPLDFSAYKIQWLDLSDQHDSWIITYPHWDLPSHHPIYLIIKGLDGFIDSYSLIDSITLFFHVRLSWILWVQLSEKRDFRPSLMHTDVFPFMAVASGPIEEEFTKLLCNMVLIQNVQSVQSSFMPTHQ